jgi:hypothetical protein
LRSPRNDHMHVEANQLGHQLGQALAATIGGTIVDNQILSLDVSELSQSSEEAIHVGPVELAGCGVQHSDSPDLACKLPARSQRPSRSTQHCDELPSSHRSCLRFIGSLPRPRMRGNGYVEGCR